MKKKDFYAGLRASLPVCIGYFSVSFGFGALAVTKGLTAIQAALMSLTNVTSAGQFAGLTVIAENGGLLAMILTQLVINSRYALMGLALGQNMDETFTLRYRFLCAFYNTDEIFALAMERGRRLTLPYLLGLGILPILGWTSGTLCGALAGSLLPPMVQTALGVALYGMFIAIVVPQVRDSRPMLFTAGIAAVLSGAFYFLPYLSELSSGLSIVICTVIAAALAALFFPIADEEVAK